MNVKYAKHKTICCFRKNHIQKSDRYLTAPAKFAIKQRRKEIPAGEFNVKPTKKAVSSGRQPHDTVALTGCYISLDGEEIESFKAYVTIRLKYINDALTIPQAASAIGYSPGTVLEHIEKKHIEAVKISGKYIIAKTCLVDFLAGDTAFGIVNKSNWLINTILKFKEN